MMAQPDFGDRLSQNNQVAAHNDNAQVHKYPQMAV